MFLYDVSDIAFIAFQNTSYFRYPFVFIVFLVQLHQSISCLINLLASRLASLLHLIDWQGSIKSNSNAHVLISYIPRAIGYIRALRLKVLVSLLLAI